MQVKRMWRVAAAGLCYILFAIGASLPALVSLVLFIVPCLQQSRQRITRACIRYLCRFYVNLMQWLWLFRYRVRWHNKAAIKGHLVIANHPMLIDALFVMAYVPNVCCIVKPALAGNLFTRLTIKAAGFIAASDDDLLSQACAVLERGENLLIFPEGTRNDFDDQLAFKRGAANIAVMANCPILPVVFYCTPRMLQKGEKWYQIPDDPAQITMLVEPSISVAESIDTSFSRTRQYRLLTDFLIDFYQHHLARSPH